MVIKKQVFVGLILFDYLFLISSISLILTVVLKLRYCSSVMNYIKEVIKPLNPLKEECIKSG